MPSTLLVRIRPAGPWRFGPDSGDRAGVSSIGHSDGVYSAITWAADRLGFRDEWLAATATANAPEVGVSSLFPFLGRLLYAIPPRNLWPPPASPRVRWKAAKLVPMSVIQDVALGKALHEERWEVDTRSQCLIPSGGVAPFRIAIRRSAAVDRHSPGRVEPHETACIEFNGNAGLWGLIAFSSPDSQSAWLERIKAAFRLLGDCGMGGERSLGWGHADSLDFQTGPLPGLLLPDWQSAESGSSRWLLSLFNPSATDSVDWSEGHWQPETRSKREGKSVRMIGEGSVLSSRAELSGRAVDVAPDGHPHPVWRSGFAVSVPLPVRAPAEAAS